MGLLSGTEWAASASGSLRVARGSALASLAVAPPQAKLRAFCRLPIGIDKGQEVGCGQFHYPSQQMPLDPAVAHVASRQTGETARLTPAPNGAEPRPGWTPAPEARPPAHPIQCPDE